MNHYARWFIHTNRLAERESIALQEFEGEDFITYPPVEGVYLHGLITGVLRAKGVTVAQTQHVTQTHSIIALVPRSAERARFPDVTYIPLTGLDDVTADLLLAWRTQTDNPACATAIEHVTRALADPAWLTKSRIQKEA